MRKVVFGGANSLDNYFARKDHSTDWLRWSNEAAEVNLCVLENVRHRAHGPEDVRGRPATQQG